jgi:hypothetical protein
MFERFLRDFDSRMFQKASEFFRNGLDLNDVPIKIKIVDNLGRGHTYGECMPHFDKDDNIDSISINVKHTASTMGMIEALAHELVHAKQWINGDMYVKVEKRYLFGLIPVPYVRRYWQDEDVTDLPYYQQPCEIQAHVLQKHLALEFFKKIEDRLEPTSLATLLHASMTQTDSTNT